MSELTPPLKWHGGKHYLASRIVELMPPHLHYVEPFAGGLSVLLAKDPEGVSEVVNDIDGRLMNFWRCLQEPKAFALLQQHAIASPFSEWLWRSAGELLARPCEYPGEICAGCAYAFLVLCRQSLAGRMASFAPLSRRRTRRGMNEQAAAWLAAVEGLPAVHERLKRVVILNHDALDVIREQDGPDTLFYLDPPYLDETRSAHDVYAHEMTREQHERMLQAARNCAGRVMISGYQSAAYTNYLYDWHEVQFELPNNAAGGESKRRMIECVWCNFNLEGGAA